MLSKAMLAEKEIWCITQCIWCKCWHRLSPRLNSNFHPGSRHLCYIGKIYFVSICRFNSILREKTPEYMQPFHSHLTGPVLIAASLSTSHSLCKLKAELSTKVLSAFFRTSVLSSRTATLSSHWRTRNLRRWTSLEGRWARDDGRHSVIDTW